MSDLNTFRTEARAWLEANCPESMRVPIRSFEDIYNGGRNPEMSHPDQKVWCDRMAERGWTVPEWPKAYGGGGLNKEEAKVLREEMARIGARPALDSFGISMLGPALLKFGNEEQKLEHLPPIVRGEIRWCQGYSEPNAGSDLASLATRAEDKGDHYIVNGQKIWTSYANKADWIFCLVRTDNTGSKHEGISFVLFDMATPGVTTRPIKLISGSSPFCETFFDDVPVLKKNLVGEEGKGWTIAKYLLTHEREMISSFGAAGGKKTLGQRAAENMGTDASGRLRAGTLRSVIAQYQLDTLAFAATMEKVTAEAKAGQGLGPASSIFKYYGTELNKRRNELLLSVEGESALGWSGEEYNEGEIARAWLRSKGNSIEGGTSEVQLNIVAKRVLGLPDA
ncbi:Acyl-CoA dehydrogenase family protein [Aequoribacter fuscus]|uniref:Acyl-CoA dehydrogenase family protein n=1 Tax=Aequoribacter fuscus TaxID=2518989 RepID=F3KYY1_9GAMM|nr:acyl-CoA dehydrogenase family protein [Aequoribacter fuscus]EGG30698.1 Acyl-CoA dehydrogenase family protein [Aequoribacter fuscus]QHJ87291.1 acyl-CoA dehydrogenase [Aequoribacter fuscus]